MTTTPVDPIVEMLIDGVWVDITADCRLNSADSGGGISITRGRPNEGNVAEPTQLDFTLNNIGGKYSPRNPSSVNFGRIGRNQPVRVGVSRRRDDFTRTLSDTWGTLPIRILPDGLPAPAERWTMTGPATAYDVNGTEATMQAGTGVRFATFGAFGDVEIKAKMKVSTRDSEFGIVLRSKSALLSTLDSTFESGVAGYVPSGFTLQASTAQFKEGSQSALATVTGSPTTATVRATDRLPVAFGETVRLRFWARLPVAGNVTGAVDWYNTGGGLISTSTTVVACAANTWTLVELTAVAPALATSLNYGPSLVSSPANGTLLFIDGLEVLNLSAGAYYYTTHITPGTTDQLRFGKWTPGTNRSVFYELPTNIVAGEYWWLKTQITGQRFRARFWKDGTPEPTVWTYRTYDDQMTDEVQVPVSGEVGLMTNNGTALMTVSEFQVDQWRAHAEIKQLPAKWDLSRTDRWVSIQARGILSRLGQGRKALKSSVTRHLGLYAGSGLHLPLEDSAGSEQAGNLAKGGRPGQILNLNYNPADTVNMPGLAGSVNLTEETASISAPITPHAFTGAETILFFYKLEALPATTSVIATILSSGYIKNWKFYVQTDGNIRMDGLDRYGTIQTTAIAFGYFGSQPIGSWLAITLYVYEGGGPSINWAVNFHKPGGTAFYTTGTTSLAGAVGVFQSINIRSTPALAAAKLSVGTIFHYPGDLPFVTNKFARAAYAYIGEESITRFLRLIEEAGIKGTSTGFSGDGTPMGAQLPSKLLDLLEECAEVEDGILMEERDDLALAIFTRGALYNQWKLGLNIDSGHLSAPLDPIDDDQGTRNDVTISRPDGSFATAVQVSGPLNINPPESDPDGVGVYDEAPEMNFARDDQLQAAADWRKNRGTIDEARYSSMTADLTASAYQSSPLLAAAALAVDSGRIIELLNAEVSPDATEQMVQSYTEKIDQYDWMLTWVTSPGTLHRVGVLNYTTRLQTKSLVLTTGFTSGSAASFTSTSLDGLLWVTSADQPAAFPFYVSISGVRFKVNSIVGTSSPQTFNIDQAPANGVIKAIPSNAPITVVAPWRVAL